MMWLSKIFLGILLLLPLNNVQGGWINSRETQDRLNAEYVKRTPEQLAHDDKTAFVVAVIAIILLSSAGMYLIFNKRGIR